MSDVMSDYRRLAGLASPQQVAEQVRAVFPGRMSGQYLAAVVGIAASGSHPVHDEPAVDRSMRLRLAWRLLGLGEAEQVLRPDRVARQCLRFARQVADEPEPRAEVPEQFTVDAAVARALACFGLGREQALRIAEARRHSYTAALAAGTPDRDLARATAVPGDGDLLRITVLLADLAWCDGRVADPAPAAELRSWLAVRYDLGLGDGIAGRLGDRMRFES
jgi:hypothetical protein